MRPSKTRETHVTETTTLIQDKAISSDMLGGSVQAYLPFKGGRGVTMGAFIEEEYNQGAPEGCVLAAMFRFADVEKSYGL